MAYEPPSDFDADPDASEQELADEVDNVVPTVGYGLTRVVGLGGSAGGIVALRQFLSAMPPSSGMAFVVILHLAPEHESQLAEVLQRATSVPVQQAVQAQKVLPDQVYVIPPAKYLSLSDGHLHLADLPHEHGRRHRQTATSISSRSHRRLEGCISLSPLGCTCTKTRIDFSIHISGELLVYEDANRFLYSHFR
jgi:hypothetical protein